MHFEDLEVWMAGDNMMAVIQQEDTCMHATVGAMAEKAQATYGDRASAMNQTVAMGQQKKNSTRAKVARVKSRQLRRTIYMCVMA